MSVTRICRVLLMNVEHDVLFTAFEPSYNSIAWTRIRPMDNFGYLWNMKHIYTCKRLKREQFRKCLFFTSLKATNLIYPTLSLYVGYSRYLYTSYIFGGLDIFIFDLLYPTNYTSTNNYYIYIQQGIVRNL